ncbi:unnamed protein product [Mesocestoides corti]|uniref:C2H2-type domain-containing protein n=1 Tax=Mesocestoides corti TaxID=53468 RepID=A0A0R3UH58_MESCO|nr:unnamed protein product [Mesocestoides corti]
MTPVSATPRAFWFPYSHKIPAFRTTNPCFDVNDCSFFFASNSPPSHHRRKHEHSETRDEEETIANHISKEKDEQAGWQEEVRIVSR